MESQKDRKMNQTPSMSYVKVHFIVVNMKIKTTFLEDNASKNLLDDFVVKKYFLNREQKALTKEKKLRKSGYFKLRTSFY